MSYDSNYMSKVSYNELRLKLHEEDFLQEVMTQNYVQMISYT